MKDEEMKDLKMNYESVCDENKVFIKQINTLKTKYNECIKELNSVGEDKNKLIKINKNLEKEVKEKIVHIDQLQDEFSKQSVKIHQYMLKLNESQQNV